MGSHHKVIESLTRKQSSTRNPQLNSPTHTNNTKFSQRISQWQRGSRIKKKNIDKNYSPRNSGISFAHVYKHSHPSLLEQQASSSGWELNEKSLIAWWMEPTKKKKKPQYEDSQINSQHSLKSPKFLQMQKNHDKNLTPEVPIFTFPRNTFIHRFIPIPCFYINFLHFR